MNLDTLIDAITDKLALEDRVILALAGPPSSGKSTLAKRLQELFGEQSIVIPMDGFHLDNELLIRKNMLERKGSPESFDVDGFSQMLVRLADKQPVFAPQFDRELDLSRSCAIEVDQQRLIIVEGNYLLFDQPIWRDLATYWSISVWLDSTLAEVEKRCLSRWLHLGLDIESAEKKVLHNDLVNARLVMNNRLLVETTIDIDSGTAAESEHTSGIALSKK